MIQNSPYRLLDIFIPPYFGCLKRFLHNIIALIALFPSFMSSQIVDTQSNAEFKKTFSLFVRRDFAEAISLSAEIRNSLRHSFEFSAGLKSPVGLLDLPILALDMIYGHAWLVQECLPCIVRMEKTVRRFILDQV
jgi:hypothetical protein